MKVIYLAAHIAKHDNYDVVYQDISGKRDIGGDMMDVDLTPYDVIIATPPCNYWSRANFRRNESTYALETKYLLPSILIRLQNQNNPYIVENVRNDNLMQKYGLFNGKSFVYQHGRHTYWTNIPFNPSTIKQVNDFVAVNKRLKGHRGLFITPDGNIVKTSGQTKLYLNLKGEIVNSDGVTRINKNTQGGDNVHQVIEYWLEIVKEQEKGN